MRVGLITLAVLCVATACGGGEDKIPTAEPTRAAAPAPAVAPQQAKPAEPARLGAELIGTSAKEWTAGPEWANSKPLRLRDLRGRVVMVRFWTDTCPFCAASLPAMQKLADEFRGEPVTFVGLYHSKPHGSERPWSVAVKRAEQLGVTFPIAYDHMWKTVRGWWLEGRARAATSSSLIIGPDGRIVFVHPGPIFHPSDDPAKAKANADYEAIRAAIRASLPRG